MNRRQIGGSAYRDNVMAVLARARPARLNADAARRASWPTSTEVIAAAAGSAQENLTCYLIHGRPRRRSWPWLRPRPRPRSRPLGQVKLLGALTSAAVTAVVIVIAVIVGAVVLRAAHRPAQPVPSGSGSVSPSPSAKFPPPPLVFHSLPLGGPRWHGHLAYAVSNGVVYLTGAATLDPGSPPHHQFLVVTLPRSARPAGVLDIAAVIDSAAGDVEVRANGKVSVFSASTHLSSVSLAGVSFPLGSR